jgi:hypothetical protein
VIDLPARRLTLYIQDDPSTRGRDTQLADAIIAAQSHVLAALDEPVIAPNDTTRAALFLLASRDDMQRISGRPLAGFVQPGEPTAFFVSAPGYRPPFDHELAHLYTLQRWGAPAAGAGSVIWLVEGIGGWINGPCQGHGNAELAAGLLRDGRLPTVSDLVTRFRELPEDVGMPAASSLVEFIQMREGLGVGEGVAGLRRRWAASATVARPDSSIERRWRAWIATLPPATLDVPRVLREGC